MPPDILEMINSRQLVEFDSWLPSEKEENEPYLSHQNSQCRRSHLTAPCPSSTRHHFLHCGAYHLLTCLMSILVKPVSPLEEGEGKRRESDKWKHTKNRAV